MATASPPLLNPRIEFHAPAPRPGRGPQFAEKFGFADAAGGCVALFVMGLGFAVSSVADLVASLGRPLPPCDLFQA